ncbi:hypothetical protein ONZ45_g14798 [Pleurotus djamor]|nr:hypothetical protein ONZ45_g14798 [Pleurotus djamor]
MASSFSEDPYHAVREEIESSLQAARTLCASYIRIRSYASKEEEKEAREELETSLDLLEVDLDDLDASVRLRSARAKASMRSQMGGTTVDSHPLSPSTNVRSPYTASHPLASTSRVHSRAGSLSMSMDGSRVGSPTPGPGKRLPGGEEDDQAAWSRVEQQMLLAEQDRTMDTISGTLNTIAQQAGLMGQEINEHVEMLGDLEEGLTVRLRSFYSFFPSTTMSDGDLSEQANRASTSTFVTALVFNVAVFAIQVGVFTLLRPYFKAIYEPRTYVPPPSKRIKPLVPDKGSKTTSLLSSFSWPLALWRANHHDIKAANGLDAYFFVRFLRMMIKIFLPIWVISWAVLLPVTSVGTGVEGNEKLNRFIFGNVAPSQLERFAAHIILVYIFTGWIFYNIRKEMKYFIVTRQKHLIDASHAASVQANTILVTGIPSRFLTVDAITKIFAHLPGGVKKIWINRDLKELPDIYNRRLKTLNKLESAETELLKTAAKARLAEEKGKLKKRKPGSAQAPAEGDVERADTSIVPRANRPQHRLGWIPFKGPKVDTIEWAREEIRICNELLERGRGAIGSDYTSAEADGAATGAEPSTKEKVSQKVGHVKAKIPGLAPKPEGTPEENSLGGDPFPVLSNDYPPLSSAFVTFNKQIAAHMGAQVLTHHAPYRMASKYLEVAPDDVIWSNLSLNPYEQKIRMLASYAATAGLILLWAIPVAFVGVISNIGQLCIQFSWLAWLCEIPDPILGIISGILPPVLLAVLMMLLPIILRLFAQLEGIPKRTGVELSLMTRFFIFQVIHSFLIITVSSGLVSAVEDLANNPTSIPTILAQKLPTASIFFLTYIVLQGFSAVAGGFLQIVALIVYYVKLILLGSTPRAVYTIKYTCRNVAWGTLFPSITLLVVISLGYSIIAPIINGFACATFFGFYMLYKWLFLWQYQQPLNTDTGGLFFPKAIQHLFVGLYIQQLCLVALFFLARDENNNAGAVAEGALMIVLIIFTALFNLLINHSYGPLIHHLPLSLADKTYDANAVASIDSDEDGSTAPVRAADQKPRASTSTAPNLPTPTEEDVRDGDIKVDISQREGEKKKADSQGMTEADYGFSHPAASRPQRTVWIPRDTLGLSKDEVEGCRAAGVDAESRDAEMNEKGKVDVSGSPPDEVRQE